MRCLCSICFDFSLADLAVDFKLSSEGTWPGKPAKSIFVPKYFSNDMNITFRHEGQCKLNPIPNAPYSVARGTANKFTLANFHAKLKK